MRARRWPLHIHDQRNATQRSAAERSKVRMSQSADSQEATWALGILHHKQPSAGQQGPLTQPQASRNVSLEKLFMVFSLKFISHCYQAAACLRPVTCQNERMQKNSQIRLSARLVTIHEIHHVIKKISMLELTKAAKIDMESWNSRSRDLSPSIQQKLSYEAWCIRVGGCSSLWLFHNGYILKQHNTTRCSSVERQRVWMGEIQGPTDSYVCACDAFRLFQG